MKREAGEERVKSKCEGGIRDLRTFLPGPDAAYGGVVKSQVLKVVVVLLAALAAVQAFRVARGTADWMLDQLSDPRVMIEMRSDRPGVAQLYWNAGRRYNEEDSATFLVKGGDRWQRLVFPVPGDPIQSARFDPLRSEGVVEIRRVELQTASGSTLLSVPLEAVQGLAQVADRERLADRLRVTFDPGAGDPMLHLGPMIADLQLGPGELPWLGTLFLGLLVVLLFALRPYGGGIVRTVSVLRTSGASWAARMASFDRPGWAAFLVGGGLIGLVQIWFLAPLHQTMDLPLWDEAGSMAGGAAFLKGDGLGYVVNSPLPKLVYAVLIAIFGPAGSVFAHHYLVKTALTVVLFLLAARLAGSVLVGLVLAGVWAVSVFSLDYPILVYQSGLVWYGLGLFVIARNLPLGLALIILATLTRLEYEFVAIPLIVFVAGALLSGRWKPRPIGRAGWGLAILGFALVLFVGGQLSGWNLGGHRGWLAVKQHYALRLWMTGEFPGQNPFLEYNLVTDRDFPGAESLGEAARINRAALVEHIGWNLRELPTAFAELFRPVGAGKFPYRLPIAVTLLLGLVGLVEMLRWPGRGLGRLGALVRRQPMATIAVLGGLLVIAPGIIVLAKSPYLLPIVPLALAGVAFFYRLGTVRPIASRAGVLLALFLVVSALVTSPRPFTFTSRPRTVLRTVEALDAVLPAEGEVVLLGVAATSYLPYLGADRLSVFDPLWPAAAHAVNPEEARINRLIERYDPDLIMIDSNWRRSSYFDPDGAARLPQLGWSGTPLPDGNLWIRPSFPSGHAREKAE